MDRRLSRPGALARWLACMVVAGLVAGCGSAAGLPAALPPATVAVYPGGAGDPLLVDTAWLSAQRTTNAGNLIILDAAPLADYRSAHIPGAVHAWWQDTMDPNGAVYGTLLKPDQNQPDPQRLRRNLIEDLGVEPDDAIVVYDHADGFRAARIVWTLRFFGYPKAALLDGGLGAWLGAGGGVEKQGNGPKAIAEAVVSPGSPQEAWYVVKDQLLGRQADPTYVVVDIRTDAERQDDIDETIPLGTIPGAIRLPWTALLAADGRLLPPAQLAAVVAAAAIPPGSHVVLLGRFGTDTGLPWLALRLAGVADVAIYDGGWNEWARDPATPKAPLPT